MSIIVAVTRNHRTVMAADTLTCFGDSQRVGPDNLVTPKIRTIGSAIVGSSGWAVYDCILRDYLYDQPTPRLDDERTIFAFFVELWKVMHDRYTFVNDQAQAKESPFGDLDSSFLIANQNGIFKVSPDLDVSHFAQYFAIGSGSDYALGALHALYEHVDSADLLAHRAAQAGIAFDVYCGGAVSSLAVDAVVPPPLSGASTALDGS